MKRYRNSVPIFLFINCCALIGLLLSIVPLPEWLAYFRPAWLAIFIIYYCIALPKFSVLGFAWCLGLLLDVMYGTVLGAHALSLLTVAYISHLFYRQIRVQPLMQQALWVFVLVLMYQFIRLFIKALSGEHFNVYYMIFPAVSSLLIWPVFASLLLYIERWFYSD